MKWHGRMVSAGGGVAAMLAMSWVLVQAQSGGGRVAIDADDIGGVVSSTKGPEAGVWVIAETTELPTKFTRIVVTDEQGRYVIPDLDTKARFQVFVRGYGLLDSARQTARAGQTLNVKVDAAPDAKTAAKVYPAAWWFAMLAAPSRDAGVRASSCLTCHQLGSKATREVPAKLQSGTASSLDIMRSRMSLGPSGPSMLMYFDQLGPDVQKAYIDWYDRIGKGEAPKVAPSRPVGVERNLVLTMWDWGSEIDGRTDMVASNVHNATINAGGRVYGVSQMTDSLTIVDPVENQASIVKVPSGAPPLVGGFSAAPNASNHFGRDAWKRSADVRSLALDTKNRAWVGARFRSEDAQPAFCTSATNPFAKVLPLRRSGRQVEVYDLKTQKWEQVDTCFSADHNMFGANNRLYFGLNSGVAWVDTDAWDRTHNAEASQGWCPGVVDTNGDGKLTEGWTEANQPVDPAKDHRVEFGCYSVAVNPKDGSLWCSGLGGKQLARIAPGANPPMTCTTELYEPPPDHRPEVFGSGGVEVDENGVAWQNWRGSGHLSAFDRSKCKSTRDPKASGQSCPEGWTFYHRGDPTFSGGSIEANQSYLQHLDAVDALGLGKGTPIYGNVNSDAFEAFIPARKQFVTLRVPYPLGFFARSGNSRIDNPNTGWKGKGFWASFSSYATWHGEGGKADGGPGMRPKAVKFQVRPNPLAK